MRTHTSFLSKATIATLPLVALGAIFWPRPSVSAPPAAAKSPLRVLIVGGGPDAPNNQVSIESNVRYVDKLTPRASRKTILYADGAKTRANVNYLHGAPTGEEDLLSWLLDEDSPEGTLRYRRTQLPVVNGSNSKPAISRALKTLNSGQNANNRTLLFFTGHGDRGRTRDGLGKLLSRPDLENNFYAGWNNSDFAVRDFAAQLKQFSPQRPVVLVMVQCFSGSFGNLIFENGNPKQPVVNRDFCGFFASIKERPAAGCTPEVNEANYQDFTSYFFAALSGQNRAGQKVSGADYDRNGQVSMLEALAYTNIHDASIDVPVATSDVFLRSLSDGSDESWWQIPYSQVLAAAAPWQKATLQELSQRLKFSGEKRLQNARKSFENIMRRDENESEETDDDSFWTPALTRDYYQWQRDLRRRFPGLQAPNGSDSRRRAQEKALSYLKARQTQTRDLRAALDSYWKDAANENSEVRQARLLRFVRAARTVILEMELKKRSDAKNLAILKRLRTYESRNPLL